MICVNPWDVRYPPSHLDEWHEHEVDVGSGQDKPNHKLHHLEQPSLPIMDRDRMCSVGGFMLEFAAVHA